jgi:benzoate-CoA ligase family protein
MTADYPEEFNIAEYFLDARIQEGRGDRIALRTDTGDHTYADVQQRANRFGHVLREAGVQPGQRVIIALPDGPEYVAALFGVLKVGAVVVMVNPDLKADAIGYFYGYTGAGVALIHADTAPAFERAAEGAETLETLLMVGSEAFDQALEEAPSELETFPSHRDDPAIWLFSGGTTGQPKAVVQPHRSFANTTDCYAKGHLGYSEDDITLSVPKLYFGYATGSNILFPFSVGASTVLYPERCQTEVLFEKIRRFQPSILINVPTMVNHMVSHEDAGNQDLSCLRLATSAGEALPEDLHARWDDTYGVDLLDGLGTAEMWHIFLSNRPGDVRPGTLGTVVEGFEVKVCDDEGAELAPGEVGLLRVRGGSRAIEYWQQPEKSNAAFDGDWYLSSDMVSRTEDGVFTYAGRSDDMLKVSGKWLSPKEVENCLVQHSAVAECAVVGVLDGAGLAKPHAFVIRGTDAEAVSDEELATELQRHVKETLAPYKYPRQVHFMEDLPRTHLGKVDRGTLRQTPSE